MFRAHTQEEWEELCTLMRTQSPSVSGYPVTEAYQRAHEQALQTPEQFSTWRPCAGKHVRKTEALSLDTIRRLYLTLDAKWRRGESITKDMVQTWLWNIRYVLDATIPTDFTAVADLIDPRCWTMPRIASVLDAEGGVGLNSSMTITLFYVAIKLLQLSDIPSWFRITENLFSALLATQLTHVYPDDLRLPFPGFLLELPSDVLTIHNDQTGMHPVRCLAVTTADYQENEQTEYSPRIIPGPRLLVLTRCDTNSRSQSPFDDNLNYISVPLYNKTASLENLIASEHEFLGTNAPAWYLDDTSIAGTIFGEQVSFVKIERTLRNLVVNFLLYINNPEADIQHANAERIRALKREKKGYKKHRAQIERLAAEPSWVVGSTIKISSELKEAVRRSAGRGAVVRKTAFQTLVRGFWRRQWYGKKSDANPKGEYQKPKWIEPHIRGGDSGVILTHDYVVE